MLQVRAAADVDLGASLGKNGNKVARPGQRGCRRALLALKRTLWRITGLRGPARCGRVPISATVEVWKGPEGASFRCLERCHSVWVCPTCAPAIRSGRARELGSALGRWLGAGGGVVMLTLTLPHDQGDRLGALFDGVASSWKAVLQDKLVRRVRARLEVVGFVRSMEVTHGENGWHPHLHVLIVTERPLERSERKALHDEAARAWCSAVVRRGWRPPSPHWGVHLVTARDGGAGEYVSKMADELLRLDAKSGRRRGLTPWQILGRAADGDLSMTRLWREYESVTFGRRAVTWSRGLRGRLGVDETSDQELVDPELDDSAVCVARLSSEIWHVVLRHPQGQALVLEAAEDGGADAVSEAVRWLSGYEPEWMDLSWWGDAKVEDSVGSEEQLSWHV